MSELEAPKSPLDSKKTGGLNGNSSNLSTVKRREESFSKKITTKIWLEKPSESNPYVAEENYCHGYDFADLLANKKFSEVLYLLFQGELPSKDESELLEALQIALINPGPRHPATRAAMNAGVGKTDLVHILPISLSVLGGEHLGATEVEQSIRFLRKNARKDPQEIAKDLLGEFEKPNNQDFHIAPGFGTRFGSIDLTAKNIAEQLIDLKKPGKTMLWAKTFVESIELFEMSWLIPGVAAAVFCDLGFQPRVAPGLFQILCAPGLYAHGIEQAGKPLTAMPFPEDSEYFIES